MPKRRIKTTTSIRKALWSGKTNNQPSLNPKIYIVTASPWEMYLGIPRLPPISSPKDLETIAYAPPEPMRMFVLTEDIDKAVQVVMRNETIIINHAPKSPAFPTTHPSRKYIITPRIVNKVGVNTPPKVPNFLIVGEAIYFFVYSEEIKIIDSNITYSIIQL